ncbi:hypothetical protein AZA_30050 [Nitrospirillum viridazoti Y2]|uniref:von Hippel-Lindau disease tumor suppressor protein n=1 Tax=Nitrospirillum amazonense TaxID=28077 RepID=A0A560IXN2_9PROT|nr:hypothetical protein [Nitrospirillum amazonense]EGY00211.1 hypothetical protein AZA_30050 [Nitrospirillum amazonense Y2]TWB63617.1 von Hippel-Lindau disease tumor suppressor protein [Nitrospirillum amazonense]
MRKFAFFCALAFPLLSASYASAQQCDNQQEASPQSRVKSGLSLQNTTTSQINVLWAGFDGVLTHYTTLQPKQSVDFISYVGHIWYLEAFTPNGAVCLGPIRPVQASACKMKISLQGGDFAYEQQGCQVE